MDTESLVPEGHLLREETPHFSTVSYNFRHRFTEETVEKVFTWILEEVAEAGYHSPKLIYVDGTHMPRIGESPPSNIPPGCLTPPPAFYEGQNFALCGGRRGALPLDPTAFWKRRAKTFILQNGFLDKTGTRPRGSTAGPCSLERHHVE